MENLAQLKELLGQYSISEIIHTHFLTKSPVCFAGNQRKIYELQLSLSEHFDIHTKNIEIVGSAKLGISLNPNPARLGEKYDKDSDIDIVVVSTELFDKAWHELIKLDFQRHKLSEPDIKSLEDSYETIHMGFISPNKLPKSMGFSQNWWKIFLELSDKELYEKREIRGRLFKNWWFVEKYYSIMLAKLSKEKS